MSGVRMADAPLFAGGGSQNLGGLHERRLRIAEPARRHDLPRLSVRVLYDLLVKYEVDPTRPLRTVGLSAEQLLATDAPVGWQQEYAFQRAFASATKDRRGAWVAAGTEYRYPLFDTLGLAIMAAPTMRHWLALAEGVKSHYSIGAYSRFENDQLVGLQMKFSAGAVDDESDEDLFRQFTICRDLALALTWLDDVWQGPFPLEHISIQMAHVPDELCALSQTPIVCGGEGMTLAWPLSLMDIGLPRSNPAVFEHFAAQARAEWHDMQSIHRRYRDVASILSAPGNAGMSLSEVAQELHVSARTLQRQLEEYGVQFRELRDNIRLAEASRLLRGTDHAVRHIAIHLGYSEVTSFNHAFRRWTGCSPIDYRRRCRA
jgi:AraC-like DNA-binding protein